jgi:hypothetical protein
MTSRPLVSGNVWIYLVVSIPRRAGNRRQAGRGCRIQKKIEAVYRFNERYFRTKIYEELIFEPSSSSLSDLRIAMSKDQSYGFVIFLISIIVAIIYLVAFFGEVFGLSPYWHELAVGIPVLLFVMLVLVISGWIGWTMLTTPPPAPLEPEPSATTTEEPASSPEETKGANARTKRRK